MTRLLPIFGLAISLLGCTTGSDLLIDQVHLAIEDHTAVNILKEIPEGAEQIAVLRASTGWGSSQGQFPVNVAVDLQRRIAAVEDLQRRAAEVGANAIVLTRLDPIGRDGAQMVGGQNAIGGRNAILFRTQLKIVEGIAIYVEQR